MDTVFFLYDFQYILDQAHKLSNCKKVLIIDRQRKNPMTEANYQQTFSTIMVVENIFSADCVTEAIVKYMEQEETVIKAILATFEGVVEVAGALRDRFGVRGISGELSEMLRNKALMKAQVRKCGLKCADLSEVRNGSDLVSFSQKAGFPFVLKPRSGFGTTHTYIIKNSTELTQYTALVEKNAQEWVAESFVFGEEYHCDSIVSGGTIIFTSIGKYHNNAIETLSGEKMDGTIVFPQSDTSEIHQRIRSFNAKVIESLDIVQSVCHLEVFVTAQGEIFFGEIGARVPGGFIGKDIQNTHGINIYELFLSLETGNSDVRITEGNHKFTGHGVFPSKQGYIEEISSEDEFRVLPGMLEVRILNKQGDFISERKSILDRTGYFIAEGESYEAVKKILDDAYKSYRLITR